MFWQESNLLWELLSVGHRWNKFLAWITSSTECNTKDHTRTHRGVKKPRLGCGHRYKLAGSLEMMLLMVNQNYCKEFLSNWRGNATPCCLATSPFRTWRRIAGSALSETINTDWHQLRRLCAEGRSEIDSHNKTIKILRGYFVNLLVKYSKQTLRVQLLSPPLPGDSTRKNSIL